MEKSLKIPLRVNETLEEASVVQRKRRKKSTALYWTISPVFIWMLGFLAIPLLLIVLVSFATRGVYGGIEYTFTLENYIRMLDPLYLKVFWSSIIIAFFTTSICVALGYPFAYFVARSPKKYRSLLLSLIIIPFWTNSLVRTYAWIVLLRTEGVINSILLHIGLISEPLQMLYNNGAVMLGMVYTLFPFMVLPLYSSIEKLDKNLLEAASDLGAKPWKTFWHITLPQTMPGVIAGSLLVFIPTLGYFFIPDLLGGGKTMIIGNLIKNQFLTARDWPFGSAVSLLLIALTFVFIGIFVRFVGKKGKVEVF